MPTYEYRCNNCSYEFEEFQSMKDLPLSVCPQCKQSNLQRVIGSGGGMIFKGSGFYLTDYKGGSSGKKDSSQGEKSDAKKKDAASGKTSETETKSEKPSSNSNTKAAS